ncbi:PAS domain S-box protein [Spirosoma sp. HMF4905]|uniref:histidine kinase n=1 Tax=Spirosoma arboris TaxID=2682092 RepID=A0A7K1SQY2_9BACT|nr:CheR family methyltransferase [Spirosoma arboris]MVM36189.1 PAS domain S-box protein [Spirosoma arboris]
MSKKKSTSETPDQPTPAETIIVGIGASAGGVEALTQFFKQVTPDSGLAYVVILHLSPDYDSQLTQILQGVASIPVHKVEQRVRVIADHVYVVPPSKHLQMEDGYLIVLPNAQIEDRRAPVDIFFRTLAESHMERAIGVILSGTGANGSMGLKRIKERGGAVFVQNPRQADYNEMPRHAIATDLVDDILPVEEIPARLRAYAHNWVALFIAGGIQPSSDEPQQALRDVFAQLRLHTGHDFTNYKRPTMLRRIERRLNVHNLLDLPTYVTFLRAHPEEVQALLKDLLISVTNFFRDRPVFTTLELQLMPLLTHAKTQDDTLRIWVAGCATGEEAYSIAILCAERTLDVVDAPTVQIFATDLDETALATAREGLYTLNDAADISPERLRRFFTKEGEVYRVRPEIRDMVLFAHHNVLKDPPFSRLNLVSCRNLLIYFNQTAQQRALETFHFALNPGGYLLLGLAETTEGKGDLYAPLNREHHLFQSRSVVNRAYPVPEISAGIGAIQKRVPGVSQANESPAHGRLSYGELHYQLLEQYGPPSILVNETFDILHVSERAGRYLQIGGGEPSKNLLQLIQPDLRLELRAAFYQAVQQRTPVVVPFLSVRLADQPHLITLHVRPVLGEGNPARGFMLVLFEPTLEEAVEPTRERPAVEPMVHQLEEELIRVKAQLKLANEQHELQAEELKAANEELQAINEELRSSAEELETSKEELQSINEELTTINQELKIKVEELLLASNNLQNLINATDIATLFLDRSLRVNLFTPATRTIFNLIATDVGRPLSDITGRLDYTQWQADAESVLATLQPIEREVGTTDGRMFMGRMIPYRTADDRINGLVLTFVDITQRKKSEEANYFLASIVESSQDSIITTNFRGLITSWNQAAEALYGYPAQEVIGQPLTLLSLPQDLAHILNNTEKIKQAQQVETYETVQITKAGQILNLEVALSPVKDAFGQVIGVSTVARDITRRKATEEILRESDRRKDEFLAMLAHELRNPLAPIRHALQLLTLNAEQNEPMRSVLDLMSRQADHLVRLVDDLLDVSRINQGKIVLQPALLDMGTLVAQAVDSVQSLYESLSRELSVSLPTEPLHIIGDATRLTQVITNLLTNGARYTLEGGQVWVDLDLVNNQVRLRVRDNGIGLAADQQERIFELFAQVDNSLARSKGGLGLGLTLVKRLVELHGGRVEVRSEGLGKGSEFLVYLPGSTGSSQGLPLTPEQSLLSTPGRRILVVDDNPDAADTFALLLEMSGYQVDVRYNGQQALEAAEHLQPEVILLDIGMSGLDGYETARLIRQQPWGRDLILIALTGYGQADDKRRSREAGFTGHLVKPVGLEAVTELLDSLLSL